MEIIIKILENSMPYILVGMIGLTAYSLIFVWLPRRNKEIDREEEEYRNTIEKINYLYDKKIQEEK